MRVERWARLAHLARPSTKKTRIVQSQQEASSCYNYRHAHFGQTKYITRLAPRRQSDILETTVQSQERASAGGRKGISSEVATTVVGILLAAGAAYTLARRSLSALAEEPPSEKRLIRLADIHEHNRTADTYWVYR